MKKNLKKVVKSNNSKQTTPIKHSSIKINSDTTCVFTTYEPGAYNRLQKDKKSLMVRKRTILNNICLKYFVSDDSKPKTFTGSWKNASKKVRLEANLEYMADGKYYTYEIID